MGSESPNGEQFSPESKKMIQRLKEVVNNADAEIYAALKECNMNPEEAVDRLLSLDSFQEVKSKRERRKEMKETQEFRPQVYSGGSNHEVGVTTEHIAGSCGSTQSNYDEHGEPADNGQNGFGAPSPHSSIIGRTADLQPSSHSDSSSTSTGSGDAVSATAQLTVGNQSAWSTTSSKHLSMAEIVKMGINPSKGSQISSETSSLHQDVFETNTFNQNVESSQNSGATVSSALDANVDANNNRSKLEYNESNMLRDYQADKVSEVGFSSENQISDQNVSGRAKIVDVSGDQSYKVHVSSNSSSYGSHRCRSENEEGKAYPSQCISDDLDVPSATVNMQQPSLRNVEPLDHCTLVLPSHLKKLADDCAPLSFGTYNLSSNSFSRYSAQNLDEIRRSIFGNGRAGIDAKYYDRPVNPQPEIVKYNVLEDLGHKDINNIQKASFGREEPTPGHMPSLYSDMAYQDSLRRDLLESTTQAVRGSDLPYSQLGRSSMPSRYRSAASSVNGPNIPMYESLRPGDLPLPEASSVLPQHLTDRQYTQPTYEQIASVIGYPIPPQSFSHPSALQQAYVGGTGLDQSVAGMEYNLPQHRNGVFTSTVPPSPGPRGHGSFATSTNVHGNYLHNSVAPVRDFDNVFPSQYKDGNHLNPLRQSLRTLPSVQDGAYNNLLGQNQQYAGYRHEQSGQFPSQTQHHESMGYPNYFNSQMGTTHECQGQRFKESHFPPGIPDLPPQQWQHHWHRKY